MGNKKQLKGLFVTCAISLGILAIFYGDVMIRPNSFFLGAEAGDALKNYYTPYYYVNHDDGGWWFDGMYHPYGEHIAYTDNQPIVSSFLKFIDTNILPVGQHTVGIINWLMFLSVVVGSGLIFLLLRRFNLPFYYSIVVAIIIAFQSPQIDRFLAHYSLSYACFVPLLWWLLIKCSEKARYFWLLLLGLTLLLFSFIQIYYLAIGGLFIICSLVYSGFINRFRKSWLIKQFIPAMLVIILSAVVVYSAISSTDPVTDRPEKPIGHLVYNASPSSVFLPHNGPILEGFNQLFDLPVVNKEGAAYVGLTAIIAVFMLLILYLRRKWNVADSEMKIAVPNYLQAGLFAGFIALIYSFAILYWWGIPPFFEPLHQIRSTGRFAWAFYYPFCVFAGWALYNIYKYFRSRRKKPLATGLLFVLLSFWAFEAFININETHFKKTELTVAWPNEGKREFIELLNKNNYKVEDFQALVGFPFFVYGSERIRQLQEHKISVALLRTSAFTGLPMVNGMLSRTSFDNSKKLIQLSGNFLLPKPALKDFTNDKPLLLIVADYKLKPNERRIIKKASKIGEWMERSVYKLPLKALEQELIKCESVDEFELSEGVIFYTYDSLPAKHSFSGKGALSISNDSILFNEVLPVEAEELEFSIWMYADSSTYYWPVFNVRLMNDKQEHIDHREIESRSAIDYHGNWTRLNLEMTNTAAVSYAKVWLHDARDITIDNFMIRNAKDSVFHQTSTGECFLNNYPLFEPSY